MWNDINFNDLPGVIKKALNEYSDKTVSKCSDIEKYGEYLMEKELVSYDSFSIMNMSDVIIITRYHREARWPQGKQ